MSDSREVEEIRQQMGRIRCDLYDDMEGIVENARVMTQWRYYVKTYPWAAVSIAAALGYLMVPKRLQIIAPDARTLAKLARQQRLVVEPQPEPHEKGGMTSKLLTLVSTMLIRGAVAYLGNEAGKLFTQKAGEPHDPALAGNKRD